MKLWLRVRMPLRFSALLVWQFRRPLAVFSALVLLGGAYMKWRYHASDLGYLEAAFGVFMLVFLEPALGFPREIDLQLFFFVVPIVGLGALADSIVRLGYLVFSEKRKLPEWQRMVASLYRDHMVVIGAGKVGYRIIKRLVELGEPVVAVERETESLFLDELHELEGVTILTGNARHRSTLEEAGVGKARAVIVATDDDLANLDAALTAQQINPRTRIVLRLFDDTLAAKVAGHFDLTALSTSQVSASAFVGAATGKNVYHDFAFDGERVHMVDMSIEGSGTLAGRTVGEIQSEYGVNVLMMRAGGELRFNPPHDVRFTAGDVAVVLAPLEKLLSCERANVSG